MTNSQRKGMVTIFARPRRSMCNARAHVTHVLTNSLNRERALHVTGPSVVR